MAETEKNWVCLKIAEAECNCLAHMCYVFEKHSNGSHEKVYN